MSYYYNCVRFRFRNKELGIVIRAYIGDLGKYMIPWQIYFLSRYNVLLV